MTRFGIQCWSRGDIRLLCHLASVSMIRKLILALILANGLPRAVQIAATATFHAHAPGFFSRGAQSKGCNEKVAAAYGPNLVPTSAEKLCFQFLASAQGRTGAFC
jgi:hypothetical protein